MLLESQMKSFSYPKDRGALVGVPGGCILDLIALSGSAGRGLEYIKQAQHNLMIFIMFCLQ